MLTNTPRFCRLNCLPRKTWSHI